VTADTAQGRVRPELLAEAGVWIARLHGDDRSRATDEGFRRWLRASAENARAFELVTDVWEDSINLRRVVELRSPVAQARRRPVVLAAAAVAAVATIAASLFAPRNEGVATEVGEQRQLTLEDGTRVFLNTATRIVVRYDDEARRIELKKGEALFSVAREPGRPFIVDAGRQEVRALGTSFVVRRDEDFLAVTLVEGAVTVAPQVPGPTDSPPQPAGPGGAERPKLAARRGAGATVALRPGQRLTFDSGVAAPVLAETSLEHAVAWRRGQVVLDDTALEAAVAEMNRYSNVRVVVQEPAAGRLLVNGLFQAGDSASFARAVAHTYGLTVLEQDGRIVLSGAPESITGRRAVP
jgi:transmembrane sensor